MNGSQYYIDEESIPYLNPEEDQYVSLTDPITLKKITSIESVISNRRKNLTEITREAVQNSKNPIKLTFENIEYEVTVKLD